MIRSLAGLAVLGLFLAACGGSGGPDAGPMGDAAASGLVPDPPQPAALPVLTPCPTGWREVMGPSGVTECDPWPESGPASCAADQAHFPGEPDCTPIGPPCPADGLPEGLPTDRATVYVRAGAIGGDGSRGRPFGTVGAGVSAVPAGGIVAIGAGRYDAAVTVPGGVTLWGACVRETVLTSSVASTTAGVVNALGPDVVVRSLSIDAPARSGLFVRSPGALHIEDIVVEDSRGFGAAVTNGGQLTGRSIALRRASTAAGGLAAVGAGATVDLERLVVESNGGAGIHVEGAGASLTLRSACVRDTTAGVAPGHGIAVLEGAQAAIQATCIDASTDAGLVVDTGSSATLEDVIVRDTRDGRLRGGIGVGVHDATVTARRLVVAGNLLDGIVVDGASAVLDLEDAVVRDTFEMDAPPDGWGLGFGVFVAQSASARLVRLMADGNHGAGVSVNEAASADLEDAICRRTLPSAFPASLDLELGSVVFPGLSVGTGSTARATRLRIEESVGAGVLVSDPSSVLEAQDLVVTDTIEGVPAEHGAAALTLQSGGRMALTRVSLARNRGWAVAVKDATLELTDARIEDSLPVESTGDFGRAIELADQTSATVRRTVIERTRDVAILVTGSELLRPEATFEDVEIRGAVGRLCATDGRCAEPAGMGVAVGYATVHLSRFGIDQAELCGVQIAAGAALDLSLGRIARASVGACVQVDGYDLTRLTDRVVYEENGVNISSTSLYVPMSSFGAL